VLTTTPSSKPRKFPGQERLKKIKTHAENSSGRLLFNGAKSQCGLKVYLSCKRGHVWAANISNLTRKKPTWCNQGACFAEVLSERRDGGSRNKTIQKIKGICEARNWTWLSGEYQSALKKNLVIKCSCEKKELYSFKSLSAEKACLPCYQRSKKMKLQEELLERQITVIGDYVDEKTGLVVQCDVCGHQWPPVPYSLRGVPSNPAGTGCPRCNGGVLIPDHVIEARGRIVVERHGGKLKSVERRFYRGHLTTMLEVQCKEGDHRPFWTEIRRLENGHWCKKCRKPGIFENAVRALFEHLVMKPFPTQKPSWLVNSDGNAMELDGYNEELGLAFEYQGEQHFRFVPFFHGSEAQFEKRVQDDETKKDLCYQRGIALICPDYSIDPDKLESFLRAELVKARPNLSLNSENLDWRGIEIGNGEFRRKHLRELQKIADERGGKCLSSVYISNSTHLWFKCAVENHKPWKAVPSSIKKGTWCDACGNAAIGDKNATPKQAIKDLCKEKGLTFLEFVRTKKGVRAYKVRYECGHEYDLTKQQIEGDRACQLCFQPRRGASQRGDLIEANKLASSRKGEVLSKYYIKSGRKLLWRCEKKHVWPANLNSVKGHKNKKGSWCPECSGRKPWAEDIKEFLRIEKNEWDSKFGK
jgi:hypothetical protein